MFFCDNQFLEQIGSVCGDVPFDFARRESSIEECDLVQFAGELDQTIVRSPKVSFILGDDSLRFGSHFRQDASPR